MNPTVRTVIAVLLLAPAQPALAADGATPPLASVAPAESRPLTVLEARTLIGHGAKTRDGVDAGLVEDFLLEPATGRIDTVVLARGGVFGLWATRVAVPVGVLRLELPADGAATADGGALAVRLDLSADELRAAPPPADDSALRSLGAKP